MTSSSKRVAVMIETQRSFGRDLIRSIARFAKAGNHWRLVLHKPQPGIPEWLRNWDGDGVIIPVYDHELAQFLAEAPFPSFNLCGSVSHSGIPEIGPDFQALAAAAVGFYLNAAFTSFAYCGYPGIWFSDLLQTAFMNELDRRRLTGNCYSTTPERAAEDLVQRENYSAESSPELTNWIRNLPPNTAILTCNDMRALQVLIAIGAAGRSVPEDLAVLGGGDDSVICELTEPSLSSLVYDAHSLATTACRELHHRMLPAAAPPPGPALSQVIHVSERASTDTTAVDDPILVSALRFIRTQCHTCIDAADILNHVKRSRNTVESRFRQYLGRTIAEEILRVRIERARILLERTTLTSEQVARACGFANGAHFTRRFKDATKVTPGEYRHIRTGKI